MAIFHDVESMSAEHQQLRLGLVTASRFDNVITAKKRQLSSQAPGLMYRLLAERVSGEPLEIESMSPAPWMQRGLDYEDEAVRCYESLQQVETARGGFFTDDAANIGCSPDRLVGDDGLLEIKCPLLPKQIETAITGDLADHVCQLQGQMLVSGRLWTDVFSYHPRIILDPVRVMRDEDFIADLDRALTVFVEEMLRRYDELVQRFGPFPLPSSAIPPIQEIADGLGVSLQDVDDLFAARRRERGE